MEELYWLDYVISASRSPARAISAKHFDFTILCKEHETNIVKNVTDWTIVRTIRSSAGEILIQ